ncbi:hypothetical protein Vafri_16033 [Volvox africanus]|nr:hypothetical protein Vafri_16033 [Volvox africanus]
MSIGCEITAPSPPHLDPDLDVRLEAVLVAGAASLLIFGQYNLTGPSYDGAPLSPLDLFTPPAVAKHMAAVQPQPSPALAAAAISAITNGGGNGGASVAAFSAATPTLTPAAAAAAEDDDVAASCNGSGATPRSDGLGGLGVDSVSRGDRWAQEQLQLDGEDFVGRCPAVQWLLLARTLLLGPLVAATPSPDHQQGQGGGQEGRRQEAASCGGVKAATITVAATAAATAAGTCRTLPFLAPLLRVTSPAYHNHDQMGGDSTAAVCSWTWSWPWWALRCVMSQQHVLEGRSHSLLSEASQLIQALVSPECPWAQPTTAAAAGDLQPSGREAAALGGVLHVELALCQYLYGYVDAGRQYLVRAGQLLGLEPQLTGALGKRTVHQIDPKAQLVVVASESLRAAPPSAAVDDAAEALGLGGATAGCTEGVPGGGELEGLSGDSDVLPAPVLVGEDGKLLDTRYSAPEQALLLAWAIAVKKGTSADDLQEWQMAPWVEAVLSQPRGVFMTLAGAKLNKIRHERTRGRTKERALLHMDQLMEAVTGAPPPPSADVSTAIGGQPTKAPSVASTGSSDGTPADGTAAVLESAVVAGRRAVLSWAVWFPLQVKLRREAAEHYVSMGLVGAAIRVFESLELWDSALTCYRLLGKKALAEELVKRRLAVTPDDPRLWCALGDMHLDDRFYEEAWRRSGGRHTRSQRSLGRNAMRRKDYAKASGHWEAAVALNPLQPESWFALGFCCLKLDRHRAALRAFTRVTQQEPDNGEAWNNIAALWMHLGGYRPAFAALSESVRHKRDSWQTWENYARAALASGHYQQAVRGLQMSLRLSAGQRLFTDVASGLLDVLEGRPPPRDGGTSLAAAAAAAAEGLRGVAVEASEAAEGPTEADASLQDDEAALGVPLLPLLSDVPLRSPGEEGDDEPSSGVHVDVNVDVAAAAMPGPGAGDAATAAPKSDSDASPPALLSGREREVVLVSLGALLREAVNSSAASATLWGCLARYWALRGEPDSAKEARVKQVRGLSGAAFKSDPEKFLEYGEASEALCRCYLEGYKQGRPGGLKDLAAARMHLRGVLRATAENFGEHPLTAKLQALLNEIMQLEDEALAASRAARS